MPVRKQDIEQQQRVATNFHLPPGPVGQKGMRFLVWTGPGPYDFGWQTDASVPDPKRGRGDPNDVVQGRMSQLYEEITTPPDLPRVWQNADGEKAWQLVGGSAASGFPVGPLDDGTATHEIQVAYPGAGAMAFTSLADDGSVNIAYYQAAGTFSGIGGAVLLVLAPVTGEQIETQGAIISGSGCGWSAVASGAGNPEARLSVATGVTGSEILANAQRVMMQELPTSDPVNPGQLWNDSGTVKISL